MIDTTRLRFFLARFSTIMLLVCSAATVMSRFPVDLHLPASSEDDRFDPRLSDIATLDDAEAHIRSGLKPSSGQAETAEAINRFMEQRFVHGSASVSFSTNWVAWLGGKLVWENLAFATLPDDMLKSHNLLCSQHAMLFQALLARFDIEYATIGFGGPRHMLVGAKVDGQWAMFDSDGEPRRSRIIAFDEISNPDILREMYRGKRGVEAYGHGNDLGRQFEAMVQRRDYGMTWINQNPAPQATIFHKVTRLASEFGWIVLVILAALSRMPRSSPRRPIRIPAAMTHATRAG